MKAIVTGASGFVGSRLVLELVRKGYQVAAIGRKSFDSLPIFRKDLLKDSQYLQLDLDSIELLETRLVDLKFDTPGEKIFFHLAWGGKSRLSDLDVSAQCNNIARTIDTYDLAGRLGVSRYIFCGTMEEAFAEKFTHLDHRMDKMFNRHSIYALAKVSARQALKWRYETCGTDIVFATNSHVMGPFDDKDSFLQVALAKILKGLNVEMSSGRQLFDVINVADCAEAIIAIANKGKLGESYWIGSGHPRPLIDFVDEMNFLFPRVNIISGSLPYNDVILDEKVFEIDKLVSDTGFNPTRSFANSVKELALHLERQL